MCFFSFKLSAHFFECFLAALTPAERAIASFLETLIRALGASFYLAANLRNLCTILAF